MGEFGYKINNYQAGSVYAVMCGVRKNYDYTKAMLTNSLFTDFISQNGLEIHGDFTRDVICILFDYGSRSFEEEAARLKDNPEKLAEIEAVRDKFDKKSADQIREIFYTEGVDIKYPRGGTIHYRMLYRTPGKAKKGSCMFIREELYDVARDFLYMGVELPEHNAPIVEMGAYSSLVTSTIIDKIQINPHDILIIKDFDSAFTTTAISVETDERRQCKAVLRQDYEVVNTAFDGQALIDLSIFPSYGEGYVLLRHHFTKAAAFATDIQGFFRDTFGDDYDTATLTDMFGGVHRVRDIKLIATDTAFKWLKVGQVTYDYWCRKVVENGCMFGVVKTAHPSKLGEVQRMSYQMVNALDINTIDSVMKVSLNYVERLKTDIEAFIQYLKRGSTYTNDYEVLVALYEQDHTFEQSDYFRRRRRKIIEEYVLNLKNGRLIQNADNLVIVGSPYAMLLRAVGKDPYEDPTFSVEDGAIQCYTARFNDGEYLAGFRSPYNSFNNMCYLHNTYRELFTKYFRLGRLVIAANMLHTDFQCRNNGSDQDSDSLYVTNQPDIVAHGKHCYKTYPTIVNNIPQEKNHYDSSLLNFAKVDNTLASAQRAIGESSNLAQVCLTYTYNFKNTKYSDYICILATLAQAAIDSAKRSFDVDIPSEIKRIKTDINIKENKYPAFWLVIRRGFNREKINPHLICPMNNVYNVRPQQYHPTTPTLPMSDFFVKYSLNMDRRISKKVEALIEKYSLSLIQRQVDEDEDLKDNSQYLLLCENFDNLIEDIRRLTLPNKYIGLMSWLLDRAFIITPAMNENVQSNLNRNKSLLLKVLYTVNPEALLKCFCKNVYTPAISGVRN